MSSNKRGKALVAWLNAVEPEYSKLPLKAIEDCYDPALLAAACRTVDAEFFKEVLQNGKETVVSTERTDNLNSLHNAIEQYFHDVIGQKTWIMPAIDTDGIAQEDNYLALIDLLVIIISMAVLSPDKEDQIRKIQTTPEWVQKELMLCIEEVRSKLPSPDPQLDVASSAMVDGSSDSLASYIDLHAAHRVLQSVHNSTKQELDALRLEHEELLRAVEQRTHAKAGDQDDTARENIYKSEIDRLQAELAKSEKVIADAELLATNQEKSVAALRKQVEELTERAEQADKLKDEMDEYRHIAEKARKLEASVEKYKKKLEEAAEAKRALKGLEEENILLLEKNARLEEDYQGVKHLKEINEQYKQSIAELESRLSNHAKEEEALQLSLDTDRKKIAILAAERDRQAGDIALLEERLGLLEGQPKRTKDANSSYARDEAIDSTDEEDSANELSGIANELDDATSGITTTELKLRIRKQERELASLKQNKADSSRILVLENLLDDAQNMKLRYEQEFLKEHKEKLVLQRQIDEIRNGESAISNDSQTNIALRIRLAETVENLDSLRKESASQLDKIAQLDGELKLARADLTLVDKSRTEMLTEVRKLVAHEQSGVEEDLKRLREELDKAKQTTSMQLSQINTLLLDKVDLQSQGIALRDTTSKSKTEDVQSSKDVMQLKSEIKELQESLNQTKEQLKKARSFIRQQDKLFKEQHQAQATAANGDRQHEVETLRAEVIKQRTLATELEQKYQAEQQLLLIAFQEAGLDKLRSQVLATGQPPQRTAPISWLAQQRARTLRYTSTDSS